MMVMLRWTWGLLILCVVAASPPRYSRQTADEYDNGFNLESEAANFDGDDFYDYTEVEEIEIRPHTPDEDIDPSYTASLEEEAEEEEKEERGAATETEDHDIPILKPLTPPGSGETGTLMGPKAVGEELRLISGDNSGSGDSGSGDWVHTNSGSGMVLGSGGSGTSGDESGSVGSGFGEDSMISYYGEDEKPFWTLESSAEEATRDRLGYEFTVMSGESGVPDVSGESGAPDVSGESGTPDVSGESGAPDVSGESGALDLSGASGLSGESGAPDTSGVSGAPDVSGESGAPDVSGDPGAIDGYGESGVPDLSGESGALDLSGASGAFDLFGASGAPRQSGGSGVPDESGESQAPDVSELPDVSGQSSAPDESGDIDFKLPEPDMTIIHGTTDPEITTEIITPDFEEEEEIFLTTPSTPQEGRDELGSGEPDIFIYQPGMSTCVLCTCLVGSVYCDDLKLDRVPPLPKSTTHFYARYNQISRISKSDFANLNKLKRIDLTSNGISKIDDNAFFGLPALEELTLRENNIRQLPALPSSMTLIDACHNQLGSVGIQKEAFRDMPGLLYLYLTDNNIDHVPVPLPDSLRSLHLQNNNVQMIHEDTFCNPHDFNYIRRSLEDIRLDGNPINLSRTPEAYICLPRVPVGALI